MKVTNKWWVGIPVQCSDSAGRGCGVTIHLEDYDDVLFVPNAPSYGFGDRGRDAVVFDCPVCEQRLSVTRGNARQARESAPSHDASE